MRKILILEQSFDPWQQIIEFQARELQGLTNYGATATFVGTMRDMNEGDDVSEMTLEHYPAMTEKQLQAIVDEAESRWPIQHTLLTHRVGVISPSDPIVLVAVWSAHRAAAFEACRFLMEDLKHKAPFWKQEKLLSGEKRWVSSNTRGTTED
jgi:molybdopterin synthase catalytic subunit